MRNTNFIFKKELCYSLPNTMYYIQMFCNWCIYNEAISELEHILIKFDWTKINLLYYTILYKMNTVFPSCDISLIVLFVGSFSDTTKLWKSTWLVLKSINDCKKISLIFCDSYLELLRHWPTFSWETLEGQSVDAVLSVINDSDFLTLLLRNFSNIPFFWKKKYKLNC